MSFWQDMFSSPVEIAKRRVDEANRRNQAREEVIEKESSLWSGIVNSPPAQVTSARHIFFAKRCDGPCLYEYVGKSPNHPVDELKYPQSNNRMYYKAGDKILLGKLSDRQLHQLFPNDLPQYNDPYAPWQKLLWCFLTENETEKYDFCWIIKSINPRVSGEGSLYMYGLILFEEYQITVREDRPVHFTQDQISDAFNLATTFSYAESISLLSRIIINISLAPLLSIGQGSSAGVKKLAKRIIVRQASKRLTPRFRQWIIKMVSVKLAEGIKDSIAEFLKTFITELLSAMSKEQAIQNLTGDRVRDPKKIKSALEKASEALLTTLLSAQFEIIIDNSEYIKKTASVDKVKAEIVKFLVLRLSSVPYELYYSTIENAISKTKTNNTPLKKSLTEGFELSLSSTLENAFLADIPGLIGTFTDNTLE